MKHLTIIKVIHSSQEMKGEYFSEKLCSRWKEKKIKLSIGELNIIL